ncbi:MAG TPA: hemolysin III family protein [Candidatus Thermoplasmatota archaeon]|nr:hemolysin III family protein [Candidatus Thermoplasmatota archaeon]
MRLRDGSPATGPGRDAPTEHAEDPRLRGLAEPQHHGRAAEALLPGSLEDARIAVDPTERFSFLSHGVGALAACAGLVLLVLRADGAREVVAATIYAASLVVLLASSALHHAIHPASPAGARTLRRMDHVAIFLLIAGTYTPATLLGLRGAWGWSLFGVIWGLAAAGVALKVLWLHAPRWLSTLVYVLMGWTVMVAFPVAWRAFGPTGFLLVLAGGVAYTAGAVVYARQRPDPWPGWLGFHGLWHVAVLVGAALHFAFVWRLL